MNKSITEIIADACYVLLRRKGPYDTPEGNIRAIQALTTDYIRALNKLDKVKIQARDIVAGLDSWKD